MLFCLNVLIKVFSIDIKLISLFLFYAVVNLLCIDIGQCGFLILKKIDKTLSKDIKLKTQQQNQQKGQSKQRQEDSLSVLKEKMTTEGVEVGGRYWNEVISEYNRSDNKTDFTVEWQIDKDRHNELDIKPINDKQKEDERILAENEVHQRQLEENRQKELEQENIRRQEKQQEQALKYEQQLKQAKEEEKKRKQEKINEKRGISDEKSKKTQNNKGKSKACEKMLNASGGRSTNQSGR